MNVHRDVLREHRLHLEDLYSWAPHALRRVLLDAVFSLPATAQVGLWQRWRSLTDSRRSQIISLLAANTHRPWLDGERASVGIDAANLELATPPEVFAPVFRYLRDQPIALLDPETVPLDARLMGDTIRELVGQRRLGMTYHVGEEFRHLLSGLRAIDEVLEFLAPMSGDRLGHGIALGLDPEVWLEQVGRQAVVPKQEWLDTLVWLYHFLGPGDDILGRLEVETNIERLGRELYLFEPNASDQAVRKSFAGARDPIQESKRDPTISPLSLYDVWLLRQRPGDGIVLVSVSSRK